MTEKIDTFVDLIIWLADNDPRDKDMEAIRDVASEVLQGKDQHETGDTKRAVSILEDRGVVKTYPWIEFYNGGYTFMPGTQACSESPSFSGSPIAMRILGGLVQVDFTWGQDVVGDTVALCQAALRGIAVRDRVRDAKGYTDFMMDYVPVPLREHEWERDVPDARGEEVSLAEYAVYHSAFRAACKHPEKYPSLAQIEKAVMEGLRAVRALQDSRTRQDSRTSGDGAPVTATTA
jgi:hypothetical protein